MISVASCGTGFLLLHNVVNTSTGSKSTNLIADTSIISDKADNPVVSISIAIKRKYLSGEVLFVMFVCLIGSKSLRAVLLISTLESSISNLGIDSKCSIYCSCNSSCLLLRFSFFGFGDGVFSVLLSVDVLISTLSSAGKK